MAEAFGEALTEQRQEIYCTGLADIRQDHLSVAFRRARFELKWFPKLAELRELAGIFPATLNIDRPGVEEAWARMPKGRGIEDESVVWCEEERIAYGACRGLLLEGDQIGARMAFKECYEKELAKARNQGTPVQWTLSAGYDVEHLLTTLATAVEAKKMTLDYALGLVPGERRDDFARRLPTAQGKGLPTGRVQSSLILPGLPGVLAKMQMEGTIPEELKAGPRSVPRPQSPDRSPGEWRELREKAKAQVEFVKRSRNAK